MVALREKKSTGEWRCQLTPWHLRSAVLNSSGNKCAEMIKLWGKRWLKRDFDPSLGALLVISRLTGTQLMFDQLNVDWSFEGLWEGPLL